MPIKQASNSVIFKVSKTISRTFNQLELIVYTLHNTTGSPVVEVSQNFIKPTDNSRVHPNFAKIPECNRQPLIVKNGNRVHPNFAKIPECNRQPLIVKNGNQGECKLSNLLQNYPGEKLKQLKDH